jgi:gliding motility-associated-like protein
MKWSLYFIVAGLISVSNFATAQCFQIESILVDACGTPEGANEMVRLKIGAQDINVNSFNISWPNNTFQGFCSNVQTANKVAQMNATVFTCGYFVEPEFDIIPASSEVLIITSEDFDPTSHNYNGLQDTLVVIFQCSGNTQGHFANWTNGCDPLASDRTITISAGPGCSQTVTYNRCSLVNQIGGIGGSSSDRDGARVNFDVNGQPSYSNEGCTIPYEPLLFDIDFVANNGEICTSQTVDVIADVEGEYTSFTWGSGSGSFNNANALSTTYAPGLFSADHYIYFNIENGCGEIRVDSLLIEILEQPICSNGLVDSFMICSGDSVELNYPSQNDLVWSTGATGQGIFVSDEGIYTVSVANDCGACVDSFYVEVVEVTADFNLSTYFGQAPLSVDVEDYNFGVSDNWFLNNSGIPYQSSFLFNEEGIYNIRLEVVDAASGCSDELTQTIVIEGNQPPVIIETFEIPNVFTPNADGENDVFGITIANDYSIAILLLNRWGNIVSEQEINANTGEFVTLWDGKVNKSTATEGVYFYKIQLTPTTAEQTQNYHGYVHLFH